MIVPTESSIFYVRSFAMLFTCALQSNENRLLSRTHITEGKCKCLEGKQLNTMSLEC